MIKDVMLFLQESAAENLKGRFPGIGRLDLGLPKEKSEWLSMFMLALEEEQVNRHSSPMNNPADRNVGSIPKSYKLIFAVSSPAHGDHYADGLGLLSAVQQFFQDNPVMDRARNGSMPSGIERLTVELQTLPTEEMTQIWQAAQLPLRPILRFSARYVYNNEDAIGVEIPSVVIKP